MYTNSNIYTDIIDKKQIYANTVHCHIYGRLQKFTLTHINRNEVITLIEQNLFYFRTYKRRRARYY